MRLLLPILILPLLLLTLSWAWALGNPERGKVKGSLVIEGGGIEPEVREVFQAFLGGATRYRGRTKKTIHVGIVPTASGTPVQSAKLFRQGLMSYGVPLSHIHILPIAVKDDESTDNVHESSWVSNSGSPLIAKEILQYDAIWFVGGDQSRITAAFYDKDQKPTPVLAAIRQIYAEGAVLGGTSAGAAIMSDPMIGEGESLDALALGASRTWGNGERGVYITRGIGFFPYGMVDQHFNQRGRFGRLLVAARETGSTVAFGVDEDTAMVVDNRERLINVAGRNGVTIIDLSHAVKEGSGPKTAMKDVLVSYLEHGDSYRIDTNTVEPAPHDSRRPYEPDDIPSMNTSILSRIKEAVTVCLLKKKNSWGIAFRLKDENGGEGYKLTFRREPDTIVWCGTRDHDAHCHAIRVHLDVVPISLQISK